MLASTITASARRLGAYGRLARSLAYSDLAWQQTDAPNVQRATVDDWTVTKVEAGGFESAYIERDGHMMPVDNAKEIYELTKQMLGSNMLRLYVSLSREGD
jgi:hypothetical protein